MTGRVTVLTPKSDGEAIELGRTVWRKQVLPVGSLNYNGRKLNFTKDYIQNLVRAFKDRAFDAVPFQLADSDNRHNNDPERTAGEVIGLEADDDGLYATVSLTDRGSELVREHQNLGVSVRIVEGFERGDGQSFPAALQHVLATWDPRINAMKPWQSVECANETDEVIDLSDLSFTDQKEGQVADDAKVTPEDDERQQLFAQFEEWLASQKKKDDDKVGADDQVDDVDDEDELDAAARKLLEAEGEFDIDDVDDDEKEPVAVAASNDDGELRSALDLANSQLSEQQIELARLRAKNDAREFEALRDELALKSGIPPRITDMCREILEGEAHNVELSNGKSVDAKSVVVNAFRELGRMHKALDLSFEQGSSEGVDVDDQESAERNEFLARVMAQGN